MPTEQNKILDGLKQQLTTASQTLSSMSAPKISASSLTSPVAPFQIPQYTPPAQTPFVPQPLVQATEDARVAMQKSQDELSSLYDTMGTQSQRKQQLETAQGIPAINSRLSELNALDAQYAAELTGITANELKQNVTGDLATNYAPLRNAISAQDTRLNIQKQQAVNIKRATNAAATAAATGQLALAQEYVQKALDAEFEPLKYQLEYKKMIYDRNKDTFDAAEKRQFEAVLKADERKYEQKKQDRSAIIALATAAAKNNSNDPKVQMAVQQAMQTDDLSKALELVGQYQNDPIQVATAVAELQTKKLQQNLLSAQIAETNANASKIRADAAEKMASTASNTPKQTYSQLSFLSKTIADANALAGASGTSGVSRAIGDWFIGDSNYRRLEAVTNTLRTNVLTLATDPNIKKFFGPQMSNADVQLMTSAGTTLNPEKQSPEDMRNELTRLNDLVSRMQSAIPSNLAQDGQTKVYQGITYKVINGQWVPQQ